MRMSVLRNKLKEKINHHKISTLLILVIPLIGLFFLSFTIGRYPIGPLEVIYVILAKFGIGGTVSPLMDTIIFQVRLPRIIAAMLVGACLSIAGASFQGLFRNPLVAPDKLGVSAGASFGAAIAILSSFGFLFIQGLAFLGGLLAVAITYFLNKTFKGTSMLTLILCGIAIESFFGAMVSLTKYVADPYEQLPTIVFWLMGSLSSVTLQQVAIVAIPMTLGITLLLAVRWRINVLSMGDEEAQTMGIDIRKIRGIIIVASTLITAASVSICGIIGWIGLIIPHVARMIVGPDHKILLPASIILGAFFLLLIDNISRTITAVEIPLGILTALIGVPFFIYLLKRSKEVWT